jgi:hypothetical protein
MTNNRCERMPADEVIRDSKTTSDKIRKLATAGYLRTEISKILGIRYQHVRRVLVDAGITSGLQRSTAVGHASQSAGLNTTEPRETSPDLLLQGGFRRLGRWTLTSAGALALDCPVPIEPGTYAFALDNVLVYVGLASRSFQHRMNDYRRGPKRQRTSSRINRLIKASLGNGQRVEVFIATPPDSDWGGLPVSTAAGLEAGLIRMIQPKWNLRGANQPA